MEDLREESKFIPFNEGWGGGFENPKKKKIQLKQICLLFGAGLILAWMTWITIMSKDNVDISNETEMEMRDFADKLIHNNYTLATIEGARQERSLSGVLEVFKRIMPILKTISTAISISCQAVTVVHQYVCIDYATCGIYHNIQEEIDADKAQIEKLKKDKPILERRIKKAKDGMTQAFEVYKYSTTNLNSLVDTVDNVKKTVDFFEKKVLENPAMKVVVNEMLVKRGFNPAAFDDVDGSMSTKDMIFAAFGMVDALSSTFTGRHLWGFGVMTAVNYAKSVKLMSKQGVENAELLLDAVGLCYDGYRTYQCIVENYNMWTNKQEERDAYRVQKIRMMEAKKHLEDVLLTAGEATKAMYGETERFVQATNNFLEAFNSSCKTSLASIHSDLSEINDNWQTIRQDLNLEVQSTIKLQTMAAIMPYLPPVAKAMMTTQSITGIKALFPNVDDEKIIESMMAAGLHLPDELWSEWEKEGTTVCECEDETVCNERWSRTCQTGKCIGPALKSVDACMTEKKMLTFFQTCKDKDKAINGLCRSTSDKTVTDGAIGRYVSANVPQANCYKDCKELPGATGCQFNINNCQQSVCYGDCFTFTERVTGQDSITTMQETCYVFKTPKGTACDSIIKTIADRTEQALTGNIGQEFHTQTLNAWMLEMSRIDSELIPSQENGWKEMIKYQSSSDDPWGGSPSNYSERSTIVLEFPQCQSATSLRVFEKCNFASNFAYYDLMYKTTGLVWLPKESKKALGQATAGLALSSSFFHASHTNLGQRLDNLMIKIIAFILYQTYVEALNLPNTTPDLILKLKEGGRPMSGVELAQDLTDMFRNQPSSDWDEHVLSLDVPNYETTFGAIILTMNAHAKSSSTMGTWTNRILIKILNIQQQDQNFLKLFEPKIVEALQDRSHYKIEEPDFMNKMTTGMKLMMAFAYQEGFQPLNRILSFIEDIGLPSINDYLDSFNTLPKIEGPAGINQNYPGEAGCGSSSAHAKWHTQSAKALLDLFNLVDELLRKQKERNEMQDP